MTGALGVLLDAEIFRAPGAAPVAALWSDGFAVDLDGAGLDAVLLHLDAYRDRLARLRDDLPVPYRLAEPTHPAAGPAPENGGARCPTSVAASS
ncbi:hypothetical protein [Streptomyces sp. XY533]|uniref:hypothetical protein n=1 Tax=Streptomyces sp. XY533 TaxID=1519481 RepID=UPI0006AF091B|nr:hypothetical protein [Streptomyces sp. XY533]KOU99108.1 hypothetical protein ADK92_12965 [Streptomyces sp. XY533]